VLLLLLLVSLEQALEPRSLWIGCEQTQGTVTHITRMSLRRIRLAVPALHTHVRKAA